MSDLATITNITSPGQIARQGDVMIVPVNGIPKGAAKVELKNRNEVVLALGEVTGHSHRMSPLLDANDNFVGSVEEFTIGEGSDKKRFVAVKGGAVVEHEEHAPIVVPEGTYEVNIQVEYTPQAIVNVSD